MRSVFIVEDEEIEREALIKLIRERYHDRIRICGFADRGDTALTRIRELNPDIVLLDIHIPGFSGLETARRLREIEIQASIVIITAYSRFEYAQEAIKLGAIDYIVKPYSLRTLEQTIEKVLSACDERLPEESVPQTPVEKAKSYIESNFSGEISLDKIAEIAGMSKYHLSRSFRAELGVGVKEYQNRCRIDQAERLIKDGLNVAEAGFAVGFSDPNYFSRIVKKYTGRSPSSMKKRN